MATSPIEMIGLLKFGKMTTSTIQLESVDEILLMTSWAEVMAS